MGWLALVFACAVATQAAEGEGDGWRDLFDGASLSGWTANREPGSFTVVDGAIRANAVGQGSAHLFYTAERNEGFEPFVNFELQVECRGEPGANSGIFFHTDQTERDPKGHYLANGYEVQLNSSEWEKRKTGSLYAVVDLDVSPVDESAWFTMTIRVVGKHIQVQVNDQQVVDYVEPENVERPAARKGRVIRADGGAIALQAHDPGSVFYFRSIRLRELPAG